MSRSDFEGDVLFVPVKNMFNFETVKGLMAKNITVVGALKPNAYLHYPPTPSERAHEDHVRMMRVVDKALPYDRTRHGKSEMAIMLNSFIQKTLDPRRTQLDLVAQASSRPWVVDYYTFSHDPLIPYRRICSKEIGVNKTDA